VGIESDQLPFSCSYSNSFGMGGEGSEIASDEIELLDCFEGIDICNFDEVVVREGGDIVLVLFCEGELWYFAASVQIDCVKVFDHII